MTKLSRSLVDPARMGWFINNLWTAITLLENKEEVKVFFREMFTPTEVQMLAKRLQIAKMIIEGYDYQTIRSYVRVGDETISRISNLLGQKGKGIKKSVKRLHKIEKKRESKLQTPSFMDIKKKYPQHFWPEKIFVLIEDSLRKRKRLKSAERM